MDKSESTSSSNNETSRRAYLLSMANWTILSVVGIFLGYPIAKIFSSHARRHKTDEDSYVPVAKLEEIQRGRPIRKAIVGAKRDAWNRQDNVNKGSVWLIKDEGGQLKAFSSICPHLGCVYGWDATDGIFVCPCHISAFSRDNGKVLKGPAPRGLDELDLRIEGEEVLVKYQRFMTGISNKKVM